MSGITDTEGNSETMAIEDWLKLLLAFRALPETKRSRTFMEVSGYPHYENVCSNILGFYFDPTAEHGLKNLLLSAFLRMAGVQETLPLLKVSVNREHCTDDGKRIDLMIDGESVVIGIENKIYHWLANDLEDYGRVIDRLGSNKEMVIKAVLCLHSVQGTEPLKGGFISYTYGQLWSHVHELLGRYSSSAHPKWVTFLLDFMETTTNLAGVNMEIKKNDHFFIENHKLIKEIFEARSEFFRRLEKRASDLKTLIANSKEKVALIQEPWIYGNLLTDDFCIVLDFKFRDRYGISFDLCLRPSGWELQLFARKDGRAYLPQLISSPVLQVRLSDSEVRDDRYIVQAWSLQTDLAEIRNAVCSWIQAVVDAHNFQPVQ
ncbi:MAG: hypothetical protein FJ395_18600 [Verrucomicrobia bacterium]|nr:hypothetical protein [Verrucomicrobiota bacterium]